MSFKRQKKTLSDKYASNTENQFSGLSKEIGQPIFFGFIKVMVCRGLKNSLNHNGNKSPCILN